MKNGWHTIEGGSVTLYVKGERYITVASWSDVNQVNLILSRFIA